MDDDLEPETEKTLPPKIELENDELASPLPTCDETIDGTNSKPVTNEKQPPLDNDQFDDPSSSSKQQLPDKDTVVSTSQYLTIQSAILSIAKRSWDSITPVVNSEIVVHGHHSDANNSTSAETVIDSDNMECKPLTEEELEKKPDENSNPDCDYVFCIATITRTSSNNLKLLAISKIDSCVNIDIKSDGSSLNGYAADYSSSSTNSTMCAQIDEKFLVPKIPVDSFVSSSSSGSSTGILPHLKSKSNNILLSKNVYTYPENLVCHQCNHIYPKVSENMNLDTNDLNSKTKLKTSVRKSKQKRKLNQLSTNKDCCSRKKLKEPKINTDIKIEDLQNNDIPGDSEENKIGYSKENKINDPIPFNLGNEVLAYWVADKLFYPALITNIVPPKYKVKFISDGVEKSLNIEALVHSSALKKGSAIAIFDTVSQEYRVGEIVSINPLSNGEKTYTIDLDSEEVIVPFDKLVLSVEYARMLQNKNVFKKYDRLSMSNVSEGKRIRSSRSTTTKSLKNNTANSKNESSKRKKTNQGSGNSKKRKCLFPVESDFRNIPSTSTGITGNDGDLYILPSSDSDIDIIREDLTNVDMNQIRNSDIDSEHLSPDKTNFVIKSPTNMSIQVFKDLHFVLSYAKYKRIPLANDSSDQGTDHDASYNSSFFIPDKPHKKLLETLIRKNGGSVHSFLNVIPRSCYKTSYLITDTPSQTCNFYLSLSLGIPSYHHEHIVKAVSLKLPFPEYLTKYNVKPLPNGYSEEKKSLIFRSPTTVHSSMFYGYIIYLALSDNEKNEFFASLLRFCGAIVYTSWQNGICLPVTRHITIIITDEHCPSELEHENVPKLSTNWLIQSLICESPRPFDGHESYVAIPDTGT